MKLSYQKQVRIIKTETKRIDIRLFGSDYRITHVPIPTETPSFNFYPFDTQTNKFVNL